MENVILGLVGAGMLVFVAVCFLWSYIRWRRSTGMMVRYHGTPGTIIPRGTRVGTEAMPGVQWVTTSRATVWPNGFCDVKAKRKMRT